MAKGIKQEEQKTAMLLHTGGLNLQELYNRYSDIRPFTESVELLDKYFAQQLDFPFERCRFRQMRQGSGESVDQFACRFRKEAISCEFENVDEAIRDQHIEKCMDWKLRRKILEKENASPKHLQDVARVQEAVHKYKLRLRIS